MKDISVNVPAKSRFGIVPSQVLTILFILNWASELEQLVATDN